MLQSQMIFPDSTPDSRAAAMCYIQEPIFNPKLLDYPRNRKVCLTKEVNRYERWVGSDFKYLAVIHVKAAAVNMVKELRKNMYTEKYVQGIKWKYRINERTDREPPQTNENLIEITELKRTITEILRIH